MDFGFENQHVVTKGGTTLIWGTASGSPILVKSGSYLYRHIPEINNIIRPIGELAYYKPKSMGYVVCFSREGDSEFREKQMVLLIPEASFFAPTSEWLSYYDIDSFISTEWLVEENRMDIYAHVFVSYTPAKTSIIPTMWLVEDVEDSDAQFGIENPYSITLYNNTKEALPAIDMDTQADIRYAVVEYFNEDKSVKVVFNRNHSAFNGSAPRDIIMKPVLAIFAKNDNAFFKGDTDEIAHEEIADIPTGTTEGFMNPPVDGPTDIDRPDGFDAAMDVMSLK